MSKPSTETEPTFEVSISGTGGHGDTCRHGFRVAMALAKALEAAANGQEKAFAVAQVAMEEAMHDWYELLWGGSEDLGDA